MLSKFKTLLIAGAALPLATGFAFAQTAAAPVTNAPAATVAPTTPTAGKDLGALKATPAEKKALHEKTSAAAPATKTAAIAKHHAVKKAQTTGVAAGKSVDPTMTQKPSDAAAPAKKL